MNSQHHLLTPNAILYISLGFHQPSLLQVIDLRPGQPSSLQMVLYDGVVYTGALYDYSSRTRNPKTVSNPAPYSALPLDDSNSSISQIKLPKALDIVRVHAVLLSKNQPLYIKQLEIVQSGIYEVLGREIITLQQYMKRRRFTPRMEIQVEDEKEQQSGKPNKHFKTNEEINVIADRAYLQKETIENQSYQIDSNQENSHTIPNPVQNIPKSVMLEIIETQQRMVIENQTFLIQQQQPIVIETQQALRRETPMIIDTQQTVRNENSMILQTHQPMAIENQLPMRSQNQLQTIAEAQVADNQPAQPVNQIENPVKQQEGIKNKKYTPTQNIISLLLQQDQVQIIQPPKTQKQKNRTANLLSMAPAPAQTTSTSNPISHTHRPLVPLSTNPAPPTPSKQTPDTQPMAIKDLYERMHRFRILCRINHLSHFTSQKGKPCTKLILIDQRGDQILCFLLEKAAERQSSGKLKLLKGRTYLFQNGQVEKDELGYLTITLPWSGILQSKSLLPSFIPTKMLTPGHVESISAMHFAEKHISSNSNSNSINNRKSTTKEVNICGIFTGLREQPKLLNNQFKVSGTLCDPQQQKSINFSMFVEQLSSFPKQGAILALHNFKILQHQNTFKLQSGKRSYYLIENNNPHTYFSELKQCSAKYSWKLVLFKNLSEIHYLPRTITELKDILSRMLEHDHCYSEIDCNIASIQEKRQFSACAACRRQTKPERGAKTYCHHCKKIQNWNKRFVLLAEVADSTASIDVTLHSEDLPAFLNLSAQDYVQMSKQDRTAHLELSTYQNVLLRIKSERIIGGSVHYVNKAETAQHKRALMQIKDKTIEKRTTYQPPW